jgi:NADPH-dependent 2,4-dienoyl-CoA reductase/sulfur reductase-like enzyme
MAPRRLVVIGGGPAGLAVVRGYREAGGDGAVALVGEEAHLPYERPPLTKGFLRGELGPEELVLEPASWFAERSIELHLGSRVQQIDPARREVRLAGGQRLAADACVLTTGARPTRPPVPGAGHEEVHQMRLLGDSERLAARAQSASCAVVIGSGFIGCEAAASLAMRGLEVTIVSGESLPQAARLGVDAGERIAAWLREAGVTLLLGVEVEAIEEGRRVRVTGRGELRADIVLVSTGVAPNGELAAQIGVQLHDGAVPVDSSMRSANPFLSAAGDVAWAEKRPRPGRGRGPRVGRRARRVERSAGFLVDDRIAHAQTRRLGRELRRSPTCRARQRGVYCLVHASRCRGRRPHAPAR